MVLQTCDTCATYTCIKSSSGSPPGVSSGSSSNAGAIAGGVVGGVAAVLIVGMFLVWKFYYKPRKQQQSKENEKNAEHRLSAETLTSLAPSALARSSNVIPIAYIPGVTTRAAIQDSTEQARVDRSSIATTNYRGSTAVIGSAMMTAIQARPNLVDIKNGEEPAPAAQKVQVCAGHAAECTLYHYRQVGWSTIAADSRGNLCWKAVRIGWSRRGGRWWTCTQSGADCVNATKSYKFDQGIFTGVCHDANVRQKSVITKSELRQPVIINYEHQYLPYCHVWNGAEVTKRAGTLMVMRVISKESLADLDGRVSSIWRSLQSVAGKAHWGVRKF